MTDIVTNQLRNLKAIASAAFLLACAVPMLGMHSGQAPNENVPVLRDAFTLKLRLDKKTAYEKQFDKVPYVDGGDVYLFVGDSFGVNVSTTGDDISGLTYARNPDKADISFKLTENLKGDKPTMLLTSWNRLKRAVFIDALMTVPATNGIQSTSIIPIQPAAGGFEIWPHPIVQLVLWNFRFSQQTSSPSSHRAVAPRYLSPVTSH